MKQTLPEIIRKDDNFRQFLLAQEGGIMKFWAEHPDRDFDANLFDDYEKQLVKAYLQANNRNRTIVSLQGDELKLEARNWYRLTEKEIHYKVVLQPILATLPKEISEQVNQHIDDYLADAYRDYRRCFFSNGITPLAFYDEVVKLFGTGGLARDCMDYVLREHHHPEVWSKKKREYTLMREFLIRQYSEMIPEDAYKLLRQAVKEKLEGKSPDECRLEAIKTMKLVKDFSRMIYSSAEVITSDCTGRYKVDKKFLRELVGGNAALLLLSKAKVPPLHECFFNFVSLLNDIGRIWAARLLKDYNIDMHELEKETGAILYPVTEPLQNPDGAVHDNYEYYVDKDYSDTLDDQCCIYDEKQAKELLDALQNEIKRENLAEIFKKEIKQLVDSINKRPELVMRLSKFVPLVKFDWSCIEAIICGLKSELLMDKAILVIVDAWERYTQKKDDICYETIEHFREYAYGQNGMYEVNRPIRMLKYIDIKKDLEGIKDSELKRRRIDARFKKMILPAAKQEPTEKHGEKPEFNYTEETFKKSAVITDTQLDLVLAELIVMGWMPTTSSQSDFHKLFSGVPGEFLLTWTGKPAQLHDFFDMLTKKKEVKKKKMPGYVTPRGNYLNIVRSHFKDENNNWFGELNHERHIDGTNEILTKLEIVLAYSVDECINMMQTIVREHKNLLENIDLSVKPEHYSNYGRKSKSV